MRGQVSGGHRSYVPHGRDGVRRESFLRAGVVRQTYLRALDVVRFTAGRGEAGRALIAGRGGPGRRPGSEPADRGRRLDGGGDLLCFRHADVRSSRPPTRLNMAVGRSVGRLSAVEQVWTLDGTASRDGRQQQQQPRAGQRSSDVQPTADTAVCHATAPQQTLADPCSVKRKR